MRTSRGCGRRRVTHSRDGDKDDDDDDERLISGVKIHVHDPGEFPEVRKKGIYVGLGKEVSVR